MSTIAVIYVPSGDYEHAAVECIEHCKRHGYEYEQSGIVRGDWDAAMRLVLSGQVQVIVVERRDHIPPGRVPRVEVVAEEPRAPDDNGRPNPCGERRRRPRPRYLR